MECCYFQASSQSQNWYMYIHRYTHAKVEGKAFTLNYNETHLVRTYLAVPVTVSSCVVCLWFKGALRLEWSSIDGWRQTGLILKVAEVWNRQQRGEFSYAGFNVPTARAIQFASMKGAEKKILAWKKACNLSLFLRLPRTCLPGAQPLWNMSVGRCDWRGSEPWPFVAVHHTVIHRL